MYVVPPRPHRPVVVPPRKHQVPVPVPVPNQALRLPPPVLPLQALPIPRPSLAPSLVDRKNSSDGSLDGTWNLWNSKKKWIQDTDKGYQWQWHQEKDIESHTEWKQTAKSWEKEQEADADADSEELDLVSGKEAQAWSVEDHSIGQWTNCLQKWEAWESWEDEELELAVASSETCCREDNNEDEEYESIVEEEEDGDNDDNEELIKTTREVLQRHRRHRGDSPVPVHRSGKLGAEAPVPVHRSGKLGAEAPVPVRSGKRGPPGKRSPLPFSRRRRRGRGRGGKSKHQHDLGRYATEDDKSECLKLEVGKLRYSQLSCKETFQCGRLISELVDDLMDRKVSLSAPFLRLTVFETIEYDPKTTEPILVLRCIDNRRLFALKEYARRSGKDRLKVNVNLFSMDTLHQCKRFIQNSDETDGRAVRLRKNNSDKHPQPQPKRPNQHRKRNRT